MFISRSFILEDIGKLEKENLECVQGWELGATLLNPASLVIVIA